MGKIDSQNNPKRLFLIDGIGAIVSAIMLGIVLPKLDHLIGMPIEIMHYLAIIASVFAIYSLACYKVDPVRWSMYLRVIGIINLTYCAVSIGLIYYYYPQLTKIGLAYFVTEKIIVFSLAIVELNSSTR